MLHRAVWKIHQPAYIYFRSAWVPDYQPTSLLIRYYRHHQTHCHLKDGYRTSGQESLPGILMPPFIVTGRVGAVGKTNLAMGITSSDCTIQKVTK